MWTLAEPAVALQLGTDERVEAPAALVVTHDQDGLPPRAGGLARPPRRDRGALPRLRPAIAEVEVQLAAAAFSVM